MKILLVSMNSIHFRRWSDQLRDSGHEVFWFDIKDQGYAPSMSWMTQITGWKKGFLKKRGRTFLKNKLPKLYNALVQKYDATVEAAFQQALLKIQPDVVHSFALYISCTPILEVMLKNKIPWVYSSWGSDLFYKDNKPKYEVEVSAVLQRVNYIITDCERDALIAYKMNFNGVHLGVFPGGGGFKLDLFASLITDVTDRKIILVKGYENNLGKASVIHKAVESLDIPKHLSIIFFACTEDFIRENKSSAPDIIYLPSIAHDQIIELMGKSLVYIGNSISDGMPNTLLEAICMGAFPIQSNPGGATAEIIKNNINGLLIEKPLDVDNIASLIEQAIQQPEMIQQAFDYNQNLAQKYLDYKIIKKEVLKAYTNIGDFKKSL